MEIRDDLDFDSGDMIVEEMLEGNTGPLLVVWRSCLTP